MDALGKGWGGGCEQKLEQVETDLRPASGERRGRAKAAREGQRQADRRGRSGAPDAVQLHESNGCAQLWSVWMAVGPTKRTVAKTVDGRGIVVLALTRGAVSASRFPA